MWRGEDGPVIEVPVLQGRRGGERIQEIANGERGRRGQLATSEALRSCWASWMLARRLFSGLLDCDSQ